MELDGLSHQVRDAAREAAYTVIGLGLLGYQKAQVRRRELEHRAPGPIRTIDAAAPKVLGLCSTAISAAESLVAEVARDLGGTFARLAASERAASQAPRAEGVTRDGCASPRGPRRGSSRGRSADASP